MARNKLHALSIMAMVVGLPLAGAPWWWPQIVGGQRAWSDEQAVEYARAAASFHHLTHDRSQQHPADTNAAATRYAQQRDALVQARSAGQTAGSVMQCLGVVSVFAGLWGYTAIKRGVIAV